MSGRSLSAGGAELRLEFEFRIGTGKVTGHADHQVKTDTAFLLHRYRYYHGARLVNADRSAEYRIIEVRSGKHALIDPQVHPEAPAEKLAAEFPLNSWFDVYDYGVGDEIIWPHAVSVTAPTEREDAAYRTWKSMGERVHRSVEWQAAGRVARRGVLLHTKRGAGVHPTVAKVL